MYMYLLKFATYTPFKRISKEIEMKIRRPHLLLSSSPSLLRPPTVSLEVMLWMCVAVSILLIHVSHGHQLRRGKITKGREVKPADEESEEDKLPFAHLAGGGFRMGSNDRELLKTGEYPLKNLRVKPFKIDRFLITNAEYMAFKQDKPRYMTQAETVGYSWVFIRHKTDKARHDTNLKHKDGSFWHAVRNATWNQPFGPGSSIVDILNYPVVHVSFHDAYSYCIWSQRRLLTEYEWEFAARGGVNDTKFPWGNESEVMRGNLWQGRFPDFNLAKDGYDGLSPVDAFRRQNKFGLYDMIGNVWEWTSTVFTIPRVANDPDNPEYSVKGGSYLDIYDGLVGREIRNSARQGLPPTYSAANLGFRCGENAREPPKPIVRHRLVDTWDYKVQQILSGVVGSFRQTGQLADEL